jgi:hypothetical protein
MVKERTHRACLNALSHNPEESANHRLIMFSFPELVGTKN